MGVNINLYVSSKKINPEKWKEVYEESVYLINNYPDEAMSLKYEPTDYDGKRYVLTKDVERNKDNEERCWQIVGDFKTHQKAESFIVYYDFNKYLKKSSDNLKSYDDILLGIDPYLSDKSDLRIIFDNKTQGYPYHSLILAVACLFESRFPYSVVVSGNIDYIQAEEAVDWANNVLDEPIELPVVVQPERLYNRLSKYYEKDKLIEIVEILYRGDNARLKKYFAESVDRETLYDAFKKRLTQYTSPGQVGAEEIFDDWLTCTENVNMLCKMACVDKDGPKFDPIEFCKSLVKMWLTIKKDEKEEYMYILKKPEGITDSITGFLFQTMVMMHMGHKTLNYVKKYHLVHIMGELFPEKVDKIKNDVEKTEKKVKKEFVSYKKKIDNFLKEVTNLKDQDDKLKCEEVQKVYPFLYFDSPDNITKENYKYIKQIAKKLPPLMKEIKKDEKWNEAFGEGFDDIESIKKYIEILVEKQGMALTEEAWERLDKENDRKILVILFLFSMIDNDELNFSNFRFNVFENKRLCEEIVKLTEDKLFPNSLS